jgi:hypothetical protein
MMRLILVLTIAVSCWREASSFSLVSSSSSSSSTRRQSTLLLFATKPNKNKNKKSPPAAGGGFGAVKAPNNDAKVRAVSGFSGSGTKPLRLAVNTFDQLLIDGGVECVSDVYVKSPTNDKTIFWFVGKVGRCTTAANLKGTSLPTAQEAVISQKRLILEYAKRELRPQNMGGPFEKGLELWLAPGDSEMDAVQNKVSFVKVTGSLATLSEGFNVGDVGYNPEIYVGDEKIKGGLRVVRDDDGNPVKPVFEVPEAM